MTPEPHDEPSHPKERAPRLSFTLGLDRAIYSHDPGAPAPARMTARLTLHVAVDPPVVLEFFSLQHYDLIIRDDNGAEVHRWSAGRVFPMIASNVPVLGDKDWIIDVDLAGAHGEPLPPGHYIAEGFLVTRTDPGTRNPIAFAKKYAASVAFAVEDAPKSKPCRHGTSVVSFKVFDLVVPREGPHGPVRPDEFSMVGVYDVDWLTDARYGRLLDNLAASPGAVKRVRLFKALSSGTREASPPLAGGDHIGSVTSPDFTVTLDALAELTRRGLTPYVVLGFFPAAVSPSPIAPPASFDDWKTLVTAFLAAVAADARFAAVPITTWWFEVWNEPNYQPFWSGTQAQYFELYQATSDAVRAWEAASGQRILLGGPAIVYDSGYDGPGWMQAFLSFVSGGSDIRCDFLSLHQKGSWSGAVDARPDIVSVVDAADDVARRALAVSPARFSGMPIVNNEVDPRANIGGPFPPSVRQDFAAWLSGVMIAYDALSSQYSDSGFRFLAASDDAHQELITATYAPLRSVMTPATSSMRDLLKVPVYGAYEILRLLGDRHGSFVSGSGNYYPHTDLFHAITVADSHIGSIFAIQPRLADTSPTPWTLDYSILDIPWPQVNVARFQIDGVRSNGHAAFVAAGSPAHPAPAVVSAIRQAQELTVFAPIQRNVTLTGGTFHDTFTIDPYTTMVYWITPFLQDTPADPVPLETAVEDGNVILRWTPNLEPWFYSYEVFLMDGRAPGARLSPDPLRAAMWVDTAPPRGTRVYGVRAMSASGMPSALVPLGSVTI